MSKKAYRPTKTRIRKKRDLSGVAGLYYQKHRIPRIGSHKARQIAYKDISKECEKDDSIYDRNYLNHELEILIFTNHQNQYQIEPLNVGEIITTKNQNTIPEEIITMDVEKENGVPWVEKETGMPWWADQNFYGFQSFMLKKKYQQHVKESTK